MSAQVVSSQCLKHITPLVAYAPSTPTSASARRCLAVVYGNKKHRKTKCVLPDASATRTFKPLWCLVLPFSHALSLAEAATECHRVAATGSTYLLFCWQPGVACAAQQLTIMAEHLSRGVSCNPNDHRVEASLYQGHNKAPIQSFHQVHSAVMHE